MTQNSAPARDIDITFCGSAGCTYGQQPTLLIQASDSSRYGVSNNGTNDGGGNVFRIIISNRSKSLQNVHTFCAQGSPCADRSFPAALIEGSDGLFYGVTQAGGAADKGTVFKVDSSGNLTTLYSFCKVGGCADGSSPAGDLIEGTDGNFYGLTLFGGNAQNVGTVFRITPQGMLTTLYTFCSLKQSCPDGADPTALFQASDGDFYGTTLDGGTVNSGTVFRITPVGDFTSLYSFCTVSNTTSACADGGNPGALVEGRRSSIQLNVTENFLSKDWNMTSTWSNGGHTFEVHGTRLYLQASVEPVGDVDLPDQDDACFLSLAKTTGAWLVTGNLKHYPVQSRGGVIVRTPAEYVAILEETS